MPRLDPASLKLFVRVVEEGTVAAAASCEHIAAAAVSKRLSEIESALRTPLLLRTNKGVEPTAAASPFWPWRGERCTSSIRSPCRCV